MSPTPEDVREALARVVASPGFVSAGRLAPFLTFVVERALSDEPLKEAIVGVEVFGRPADYDPRLDPIVRVEARRLRSRLAEYYDGPGAEDPVRIQLPKGTYAPVFESRGPVTDGPQDPRAGARWRRGAWVAALGVAAAVVAVVAAVRVSRPHPEAPPSVAVLPFVNLSDQSSDEYFSDGLSEEIIDRLARIEELRVVARSSSFQFREAPADLREVGRRLNASAVVEGSVRRSGGKLRVTAQLVSTEDGYQLWSHRYESAADDVFDIQDSIARAIANALRVELRVGFEPRPEAPTGSLEAYDLFLEGRYHTMRDALPGLELAADRFQRATEADPRYADAHAALAQVHALLAYYRLRRPDEAWPRAKAAAERALDLDPSLAEAHAVLGLVEAHHEWRWDDAEPYFLRALELDPDSSDVHVSYAWGVLLPRGRTGEALSHAERAFELDPESSLAHLVHSFALLIEGRHAEAIESYRRAARLNPSHADVQWDLGMALAFAGQREAALQQFELAGRMREGGQWEPGATEHALLGETERARAEIEAWTRDSSARAVFVAYAYALVGDADNASAWLERAYAERDPQVVWAKVDPRLARVRADPRIQRVIGQIGL